MADDGKPGPTPSEAIFFFNIVQHMKNKGDIDWDAVAESSGFKNAGVARVRFGQIKRKYGLEGDSPSKKNAKAAGDLPPTPTKVTKARKAQRPRRVKKEELEEEDDDEREMPRRATKDKSVTPAAVKEEEEDGDDWEEEMKSEQPTDGFTYF